ncbi:Mediator of RNA polymerase II transcription subunit 6 [Microsporum canis]|uniref:Mediator of RNA polymerase II transcription subunit 6 n=1 Tax=Arthroderma otae (strain ATCC MYA-4605 / CBS 113480) TaxID=554155 RepID=C5FRX8_ARTOC|nr:mediator of RNA polymerase II transcription subunit 6 [Microsporum canis CBS 113480]EEQ32631.1 mediator of RNA polymerase II transcription subunit 6 [Microsporum canis CBS 113480]
MEISTDVVLEEITWRSPQHVQLMGGFIHSNNVLFYFAESPFFDSTSNNATLTLQAMHNENFRQFIETREAFEGRLKTMQGLEFVVARDPIEEAAAAVAAGNAPQEPSNIWVIRKQNRRRLPGMQEDVQILATYFVVGDSVYMAPSLMSVVGRRMLSTVTSLTKILPVASKELLFMPSHGHTYTAPIQRHTEPSQVGVPQSAQAGKEATPVPGPQNTSTSPSSSKLSAAATQDMRNLSDALNLLSRYGDEYMDEMPLVGEPGSFIISKNAGNSSNTLAVPGTEHSGASGATAKSVARSPSGTPVPKLGGPDTPGASPALGGVSDFNQPAAGKGKKRAINNIL